MKGPLEGGRVVHYRGSRSAKVVVVGEAPGEQEENIGLPFVGRSGQLLNKILSAAGFDIERDVYITNVVKRRPPGNRDPTEEEIEFYKPLLIEEIRLVDPWIVICTGRHSTRALLGVKGNLSELRGQWFERDGRLYTPIFHPSYLLRNPSREPGGPKSLTWMDIQVVKQKFDDRVKRSQLQLEEADLLRRSNNERIADTIETESWMEMDCPCSDFDNRDD
jgi:DNA polymerase